MLDYQLTHSQFGREVIFRPPRIDTLDEQFHAFGEIFTSAAITNGLLPTTLAKALENQTIYETKKREQQKQQESQLKLLNDREALARSN